MSTDRLGRLAAIRAETPGAISAAAASRQRATSKLGPHGRLMLIAADHTARGLLRAGTDGMAMADRSDLLDRLCVALSRPGVNGILGTPDILDDLLLLGALDAKLVVGSMNRAGLAGAVFEIDDRFTAFDPDSLLEAGFDGGKMLVRIDPTDASTPSALEACGQAVGGLARRGLMAMVEPFVAERSSGQLRNELTPEAMIRAMAVASALGPTSAYTWLKVPVVDEMERVMSSSSLPAVILGGDVSDDPDRAYARWQRALALPTVKGLAIGRSLLYPPGGDVAKAVDTAVSLL